MNPTKDEVIKLLECIDLAYSKKQISENAYNLAHSYFDVLIK